MSRKRFVKEEPIINATTEEPTGKSIEDILVERQGKVATVEIYSNSTEFLMMFSNDYSIKAKMQDIRAKRVSVEVYHGLGEVTLNFFKTRRHAKKAKKAIVESLVSKLENMGKGESDET